MTKHPFLEEALQKNTKLYDTIIAHSDTTYFETLFRELFENSCEGIENKVVETRPDIIGVSSLFSELEFAKYLLRKKMKVKLLSCNDFEGRSPPDIWVQSGSREYLVEVKNITDDRVINVLGREIASILNSRGHSFAVIVGSLKSMSMPTYFHETRAEKEKLLQPILEEFREKIEGISLGSLPITIRTALVDVELHKTKFEESYFGGTTMYEAIGEPDDYRERIRLDVHQKAEKRKEWLKEELDRPYIIAIDDEAMFFHSDSYNTELFGNATTYQYRVPETGINHEIEEAVKNGWKEYLQKMRILQIDRTVIPENERGLFFTDPATKNVSAVLLMHQWRFYILANPFADGRINDPAIFRDFADCLSGWEWEG
jgi:predicted house-cleaning noncanonical NTP pyrophosphatase (MazG superfamily)